MANFFGEVYGQFGSVWRKLSMGQKIIICLVSAALTAGVAGVVYWTGQLEMRPLYASLPLKDVGEIEAKLTDLGIPYEVESGGRIMVPQDQVYRIRGVLATEGLPRGDGQGLEIFDEVQMGVTDFIQNVNHTRALQTELKRTISSLNPILSASVLLTRPKPSIFTEMNSAPTASVVLKLVPGYRLTQQELAGVTHIVACAVEGMKTEDVKITDQNGKLLTRPVDDPMSLAAGTHLEYQHARERHLEQKALKGLDSMFGPNKVQVVCSLDINTDQVEEREETFSQPSGGKLITTEKVDTTDTSSSPSKSTGGTGTESKLTQGEGGKTTESETSTSDKSERSFAVNKNETKKVVGPKVERITLAIAIDESVQQQQAEIEKYVQSAVGFDSDRDTSSTIVTPFPEPPAEEENQDLAGYEQKEMIITIVKYTIQGLSVAAVILVLFIIMKRTEKKIAVASSQRTKGVEAIEEERVANDRKRTKDDVISAVQTDPRLASEILHDWLEKEEQTK